MSLYVLYVYRKPILSLTVITHVQYHCVKLIKKGEQLKKKYRLYTLIPFPNPPYPLLMLARPGFTSWHDLGSQPAGVVTHSLKPLSYCQFLWLAHQISLYSIFLFSFLS